MIRVVGLEECWTIVVLVPDVHDDRCGGSVDAALWRRPYLVLGGLDWSVGEDSIADVHPEGVGALSLTIKSLAVGTKHGQA